MVGRASERGFAFLRLFMLCVNIATMKIPKPGVFMISLHQAT